MQLRRYSTGQLVTLEVNAPVGAGGEARIYAVRNEGRLVAKVYHKPTETHAQKLFTMLANPPGDPVAAHGGISIAWPTDLLYSVDRNSRVIGFLMPRVTGRYPVFTFYNPATRRQQFPLFNYAALLHVARNLSTIVHAGHSHGYVIGDVNESNIRGCPRCLPQLV